MPYRYTIYPIRHQHSFMEVKQPLCALLIPFVSVSHSCHFTGSGVVDPLWHIWHWISISYGQKHVYWTLWKYFPGEHQWQTFNLNMVHRPDLWTFILNIIIKKESQCLAWFLIHFKRHIYQAPWLYNWYYTRLEHELEINQW